MLKANYLLSTWLRIRKRTALENVRIILINFTLLLLILIFHFPSMGWGCKRKTRDYNLFIIFRMKIKVKWRLCLRNWRINGLELKIVA